MDRIIVFINILHTPLGTTVNYSTTANLCTLQFTAANTTVLSLLQSHWITHSKYGGTIAHVKSSLHSQTSNSTELHSIILMPQFLTSAPLLPSSYPERLSSRNATNSLPFLLNRLRLPSRETLSIQFSAAWGLRYIASGRTQQKTPFQSL
jgi:hypothetical protein